MYKQDLFFGGHGAIRITTVGVGIIGVGIIGAGM
jgi:hypothetical protein